MLTTLDEIADGIYRISTFVPEIARTGYPSTSFYWTRKSRCSTTRG
jgi:hypothetical protein